MYDLNNLDPMEFERFCCDYMHRITGIEFKYFAAGKDGGIDLISIDEKIICQCKRYTSTPLVTACKNEVKKITKLSFDKYYLLTTKTISEATTKKIYNIFKNYMDDMSYIISANEINDFLSDNNNTDILMKHHKLWLLSSNILDLYMQKYVNRISKLELERAKDERKYFVETKPYHDAIDAIDKKRILLITGDPGIGKSITSRMIIFYLLGKYQEYEFVTAPTHNIKNIIETMDSEKKEIIFLDDVFGQTCERIDISYLKDLGYLLDIIKSCSNKILIMNSRITIYNKVRDTQSMIGKLEIDNSFKECLINVNDISMNDKIRIMCNLLFVNDIDYNEFKIIKDNYKTIINHQGYNTRIIEVSIDMYKKSKGEHLYDILINNLNNPSKVWQNEFESIGRYDTIVMQQLYLLGDTWIPYKTLHECVCSFINNNGIDIDNTNFQLSINRLSESMIKQRVVDSVKYINVLNPSINDYIQNDLKNNYTLQEQLFKGINNIEQLEKLISINSKYQTKTIDLENLDYYISPHNRNNNVKEIKILRYIYSHSYLDKKIIGLVKKIYNHSIYESIQIDCLLMNKIRNFYSLEDIPYKYELIKQIFSVAEYSDLLELIRLYYLEEKVDMADIKSIFDDGVIAAVTTELIDKCNDELADYIWNMDSSEKYDLSEDKHQLLVKNDFRESLNSILNEIYDNKLSDIINELSYYDYELSSIDIIETNVLACISINDIIDSDCYDSRHDFKEYIDEDYYSSDMSISQLLEQYSINEYGTI